MMSKLLGAVKNLSLPVRNFSLTAQAHLKEGDTASLIRKITSEDLKVFGDLVGDHNPVHFNAGDDNVGTVVHGTLLLGLVSGLMATSLPGPGTVLTNMTSKFVKPCPCPTTVEVKVVLGRVRKITKADFTVKNMDKGEVVVMGEVSCFLSREQLQQQTNES